MIRWCCSAGAWVSPPLSTGTPLKQVSRADSLSMNASGAARPLAAGPTEDRSRLLLRVDPLPPRRIEYFGLAGLESPYPGRCFSDMLVNNLAYPASWRRTGLGKRCANRFVVSPVPFDVHRCYTDCPEATPCTLPKMRSARFSATRHSFPRFAKRWWTIPQD